VISELRYKGKRWLRRAQTKFAFVKRILFLYARPAVWKNRKYADFIENHHALINACILCLISIAIVWKHRRTLKSRTLLNIFKVII
jgi:hypothetical protein